jgi:hypothetical protein
MIRTAIAATVTLSALILWRYTYPYTCLSLVIPLFFAIVICAGRFVARMHRRRYWASYYLIENSPLYHLVTGRIFSLILAIITGCVYAFSLSAFTALGGAFEISMLFLNGLLALILHPIASALIQRHAATGVVNHATKRLLTLSCFTITAIIYIAILLNTTIPDYIDPTSLRDSVNAASQQVASQCPFINISLKGIQEFTATQWFFMVASTGFLESSMLKYASWLIFLGYSSLALMGMSLLSAELAVFSSARSKYPQD